MKKFSKKPENPRKEASLAAEHTSTFSSAAKVFAIPELLEIILVDLSFIDVVSVFALKRVNTAFNETINTNKQIRRNICLDPVLESEEEKVGYFGKGPRLNPLCLDTGVGGLLWPALRQAWSNLDEQYPTDHWVNLDYSSNVPKDWKALQHGSWRQTKFARSATSFLVSFTMTDKSKASASLSRYTPQVRSHTTLGEIVDKWVDMVVERRKRGKGK